MKPAALQAGHAWTLGCGQRQGGTIHAGTRPEGTCEASSGKLRVPQSGGAEPDDQSQGTKRQESQGRPLALGSPSKGGEENDSGGMAHDDLLTDGSTLL
jgi:hypothetical protein